MASSPLSGALAAQIYKGMRKLFLDATLTRDVPGTATDLADPPAPTPTDYSCKAIHDTYSAYHRASGLVNEGDVKIIILVGSLSITPLAGDRITIRGKTFSLVKTDTDPALATWECQARGAVIGLAPTDQTPPGGESNPIPIIF